MFACFSWSHWALAHPISFIFLNRSWNEKNCGETDSMIFWLGFWMYLIRRLLEVVYFGKLMYFENWWCKIEHLCMETTSFQFDFYYWSFTFKFGSKLYRVLARVRQASRRYPLVRFRESKASQFPSFISLFHFGSIHLLSTIPSWLFLQVVANLMVATPTNQTLSPLPPTIILSVICFPTISTDQARSHFLTFSRNFLLSYLTSFCRPFI